MDYMNNAMQAMSNMQSKRMEIENRNEGLLQTQREIDEQGGGFSIPRTGFDLNNEGLSDQDIQELNDRYVPQGFSAIPTERLTPEQRRRQEINQRLIANGLPPLPGN